MGDKPSNFTRWRVEHARDPDTNTTPRVEAAKQAGQTLFHDSLGTRALERLQTTDTASCPDLAESEIQTLGEQLSNHIDPDAAPSRLAIHQDLIEQGELEPSELAAERIWNRWEDALLDQLDLDTIQHLATDIAE